MSSDTATPITQLSEAARQSAARIESLAAEIVALRARVDGLDTRVEAANTSAQQSLSRWEALPAELARLARLEAALTQLRVELTHGQAAHQDATASEVRSLQGRLADEARRLSLEVGLLVPRLEALEAQVPRLDGLERERASLARAVQAQDARLDAVAAERAVFQEEIGRAEQRNQARAEAMQAQVREQEAEMGQWRTRIESQAELVREARAVAEHMRAEANRLAQDHHAMAEAERMFEQRVEGLLSGLRREVAEEWQRFRRDRALDWSTLAQANDRRDRLDAQLTERLDGLAERLEALERDATAGLATRAAEIRALRQDLASALGAWRQTLGEATELVEATVGQSETAAAVEERRQALRRALRAQRAAREG